MDRYNKGIIYTNDNCIGCNKCISDCSLMGANVSVVKNGITRMAIDSRKCNDCGKCISVCIHHARSYRDDTDSFLQDLKAGEKISLILAPSFYAIYGEQASQIIGCLKALGVEKIYDGAFGREISAYLTVKYIKEHQQNSDNNRAFISNACPALVTVIQKYHPFLLKKLIPVQPSLICTAIYAKKYLGDNNKIACLGTCIAHKDETESQNTDGSISYNLTFGHLMPKLSEYNFSDYSGEADLKSEGIGSLISKNSEFAEIISYFFSRTETIISLIGFNKDNMDSLYMSFNEKYKETLPLLIEISACKNGCIAGPGVDFLSFNKENVYSSTIAIRNKFYQHYKDIENPEKLWKHFSSQFKYLRPEDFERTYTDFSRQQFKIPQSAVDEIYNDMLKDTPQKQNMNCGSCGYNSCQDMVRAIAYGYARKESCIHYMNDLMLRRLFTDVDTGVLTPVAFKKEGEALLKKNPDKNFIVAVGDVNKLRIINDLYGFETGTAILKLVAATLRQIAGDEGLVARLGGGNFALCMENSVDNLQRLQSCKIFDCSSLNITFPVTMHFGIRITNASIGLGQAMTQASLGMADYISSVQNTYTAFTEKNLEQTHVEADITAKMQPAMNNAEFKIWYQPQYSSSTGELVGAEALCRWIKKDGTIISPSLFIPVAEKNGFIRFLDEAIWTKVFESVSSWLKQGIDLVPISINISRVSLESDKLYYTIKRLKEKYAVPEKYIHFEITESAAINAQNYLTSRIEKLRSLGFSIAMDDFGIGYSSLNSLKDMPIDILKLDMGFMRGDNNQNRGGTIINYVVRMAQGLEYITVAEGVETQEQADFLRSIGVNVIQGFLYAKPMPEQDFLELLKKSSKHGTVSRPRTFGQIDVRKFLTPDSSESLMFEEFTGPAAIFEFDEKTQALVLIRANLKFLSLFEIEELSFADARKSLKNLIKKAAYIELLEKFKESLADNKEVTFNVEVRTYIKQRPLWVKTHLWEISRNGQKHSFYILAEDVTNEKITENTLALSNNQLGMMMDNSQVGLCLMHVELEMRHLFSSVLHVRVMRVNQTFLELSGFSEEEILNWTEKEVFNVIHPQDRGGFKTAIVKAFLGKFKKPFFYDYRAIKKDGSYTKVRILINGIQQPDKSFMLITNYILLE